MAARGGTSVWLTPLLFMMVIGALTWIIIRGAEVPVSPVRVVGALVLAAVVIVGWASADRRLVQLLVPARSWLYVVACVAASLTASAAFFGLLGFLGDAVPAMVGSALGQVFGARRRAERVDHVPDGVLDKDDGRRWRIGSP